jgi:hypothetical protein
MQAISSVFKWSMVLTGMTAVSIVGAALWFWVLIEALVLLMNFSQ